GRVGIPLRVRVVVVAGDVIADRGPVLVRRHLKSNESRWIDPDDHALDSEDHAVAGQRILPGLQLRRADVRRDEIHLARTARVMLEGRDAPRVSGPAQYGVVALDPSGVTGRV